MSDYHGNCEVKKLKGGVPWHSGKALDSESRDPMFNPNWPHRVMFLSKAHLPHY